MPCERMPYEMPAILPLFSSTAQAALVTLTGELGYCCNNLNIESIQVEMFEVG
jgi:hypothetical protein